MLADTALDVTVRCYCVRASCPARPRPPCWLVRLLKGRSIPAADAVLELRARGILSVVRIHSSTHVSKPPTQHAAGQAGGAAGASPTLSSMSARSTPLPSSAARGC
jgi:hypothetical protein